MIQALTCTTNADVRRSATRLRGSNIKSPYPNVVPRSVTITFEFPAQNTCPLSFCLFPFLVVARCTDVVCHDAMHDYEPTTRAFSTACFIMEGAANCPFLMLTMRPVAAAATMRSV